MTLEEVRFGPSASWLERRGPAIQHKMPAEIEQGVGLKTSAGVQRSSLNGSLGEAREIGFSLRGVSPGNGTVVDPSSRLRPGPSMAC